MKHFLIKLTIVVTGLLIAKVSFAKQVVTTDVKELDSDKNETLTIKEVEEDNFKMIPLLTSTPVAGVGFGGAASYLYKLDKNSSKSQLSFGGQYTTQGSITAFIKNRAFFQGNDLISYTAFLPGKTFTSFNQDNGKVEYKTLSTLFSQRLVKRLFDNFFVGGKLMYRDYSISPENNLGEDFIEQNGIEDENSIGFGLALTLDSRKNKYFPRSAYIVDADLDSYPDWLGSDRPFEKLTLNARYYVQGFNLLDVIALQYYGEYISDNAPDSALPTISGKSLLRGFPSGQFRAKYLSGGQAEYRYQVQNTRFRLTSFVGGAKLQGGSEGVDGNSRDDDGNYFAYGFGVRYILQPKTGVDLRLDFVRTSVNENSMYLLLNQAF